MNRSKLGVPVLTIALLCAAALTQAQQAKTSPQATATATATAAPAVAQKSAPAVKAEGGLTPEMLHEARDEGFKPVSRHKVTFYCKSEIIVGSAFPIHTCYNEDQLKVVLQQHQTERTQLQQMHSGGLQTH